MVKHVTRKQGDREEGDDVKGGDLGKIQGRFRDR